MASHAICDCEALPTLRFRQLGFYFMKPGGLQNITCSRILYIVQGVGAAECVNIRSGQKSLMVEVLGSLRYLPLYILF